MFVGKRIYLALFLPLITHLIIYHIQVQKRRNEKDSMRYLMINLKLFPDTHV